MLCVLFVALFVGFVVVDVVVVVFPPCKMAMHEKGGEGGEEYQLL